MRITEYQYDALGRRIRKVHKDESGNVIGGTEFYWNDDVLLSEQPADITAEQQGNSKVYVFEPGTFKPLAFVQRGEINHYHLDHLGTPQEITNANGELVWTAQYKAYGSLALAAVQQVENNLRFQGQYYDEESGLHYNRHRYYDPECGRFINQDPIGLLGGDNNYLYVPNPVTWVDPLGLSCKEGIESTVSRVRELSPTLDFNLEMLEACGWKIDFEGELNKGSYCNKGEKIIVLDKSLLTNPSDLIQTLAHESGHAMYIADPYIPYTNLTKKEYVDANVNSLLKDEGEATITNIEIRNEILAKTGHDIGVAGNHSVEYNSIHDEMVSGGIDRDEAREKIGAVFADNERPSTAPDKTYREYYAKNYEDHYDKNNK